MQTLNLTPAQLRAYNAFTAPRNKTVPAIKAAVAQALPNAQPLLQTQYMLQMYYDLTNGSKVASSFWALRPTYGKAYPHQVTQVQASIAQGIATYKPATIAKWLLAAQTLLNN